VKRPPTILFVLAAAALALPGATLERLTLDDMIAKSTMVVRGRVSDSWVAMTGAVIYTHYKVQVSESLKGNPGSSVEVMVPGGTLNGRKQSLAGSPVLHRGDEFVFFLWTSRTGITWITGLTQGLFALPGDSTADPMARRAATSELMLDPATARPVKDAALAMKLSDLRQRIAAVVVAGGGQ
jgi:hypothetical protein